MSISDLPGPGPQTSPTLIKAKFICPGLHKLREVCVCCVYGLITICLCMYVCLCVCILCACVYVCVCMCACMIRSLLNKSTRVVWRNFSTQFRNVH